MNDDRMLELPPEREISPELRSQVLLNATDPATRLAPRKRLPWGPALAGLAAAAVVAAVAVSFLDRDHDPADQPPIAGNETLTAPTVEPHPSVAVDVKELTDAQKQAARLSCFGPTLPETMGRVLTARLLRSVDADIRAVGFTNQDSANQYFCTPYGTVVTHLSQTQVSNATPVVVVPGSHIEQWTPDPDGGGGTTLVDGAWFSLNPGVTTIEVRVVVAGDAGEWYATVQHSSYVFGSAWRHLTADELAGGVSVEYRALTVDGQIISIPSFG